MRDRRQELAPHHLQLAFLRAVQEQKPAADDDPRGVSYRLAPPFVDAQPLVVHGADLAALRRRRRGVQLADGAHERVAVGHGGTSELRRERLAAPHRRAENRRRLRARVRDHAARIGDDDRIRGDGERPHAVAGAAFGDRRAERGRGTDGFNNHIRTMSCGQFP